MNKMGMKKIGRSGLGTQSHLNAFNAWNIWCRSMTTAMIVVRGLIVCGGITCRGRRQSSVSLFAIIRHIINNGGPVSWRLWRIFVSDLLTPHPFDVNRATAYLGCHHYNLSKMAAVQCFGYIAARYLEVYLLLLSWGQWRISAPSQQRVVVLTLVTL